MAVNRKRWRTDAVAIVNDGGVDLSGRVVGAVAAATSPMDFPPEIPAGCRAARDSIVYLGAPPVVNEIVGNDTFGSDAIDRDPQPVRLFSALERLQITPHESALAGRQKSAGWLGSVVIHGIILLIVAFLIAPADFGGQGTHPLIVTLSERSTELPAPVLLVNQIAEDDSSLLSEKEEQPELLEPVLVQIDIGRPAIKVGGTQFLSGRAAGQKNGGSRGSFFGIETVGQEFVYVVDRSSSMDGVRYHRAISELKRSINELRSDQKFFVILFCESSLPMFDGDQGMQMIAATAENKQRLNDWLSTISTSGGTSPAESMRVSLQMSPSAIFMLSDGEFIERKSRKRGGILQGGGDTLSIVQASGWRIPIHAIAFEDPRSCANMERIAEISGGEYRFVDSPGKTEAQPATEVNQLAMKRDRWEEVVRLLPDAIATAEAKQHLDQVRQQIQAESHLDAELIRLMDDTLRK